MPSRPGNTREVEARKDDKRGDAGQPGDAARAKGARPAAVREERLKGEVP